MLLIRKCWPCQCFVNMRWLLHSGEMTGYVTILDISNPIGPIHANTVAKHIKFIVGQIFLHLSVLIHPHTIGLLMSKEFMQFVTDGQFGKS